MWEDFWQDQEHSRHHLEECIYVFIKENMSFFKKQILSFSNLRNKGRVGVLQFELSCFLNLPTYCPFYLCANHFTLPYNPAIHPLPKNSCLSIHSLKSLSPLPHFRWKETSTSSSSTFYFLALPAQLQLNARTDMVTKSSTILRSGKDNDRLLAQLPSMHRGLAM